MPYAKNKDAVAICNRSGFKYPRVELIEDGYLRGLLVHYSEYDPYHPQERPFDPDEGIAIYRPAPDLMPEPPSPVLSAVFGATSAALSWTQANPPGSTVVNWQVWRDPTGGAQIGTGFVQIATVIPTPPNIVQDVDFIQRDGTPTGGGIVNSANLGEQTGTFTDTNSGPGIAYYIVAQTADTSNTQSPTTPVNGLVSAPSNIVQQPLEWTAQTAVGTGLGGIASDANGNTLVVDTSTGHTFKSTNGGRSFTQVGTLPGATLGFGGSMIAAPNGTWIYGGNANPVFRSTNLGTSWSAISTGSSSAGFGIVATDGHGNWVVATNVVNGTWAYSRNDGVTWSTTTPPNNNGVNTLNSIVWDGSQFIATTFESSTVLTSPTGVTWTANAMPVNSVAKILWSQIAGYVMIDDGGTIYQATSFANLMDGAWSSQPTGLPISGQIEAAALFGGTLFLGTQGPNVANGDVSRTPAQGWYFSVLGMASNDYPYQFAYDTKNGELIAAGSQAGSVSTFP